MTHVLAPGVRVKARSGDAIVWHNLDDLGRRDERLEHAGDAVDEGEKWGVNIWLYSCAALQNKATIRARTSKQVMAELKKFVADADSLDPGTFPRDLFKSPQDPTPIDAFPILQRFAQVSDAFGRARSPRSRKMPRLVRRPCRPTRGAASTSSERSVSAPRVSPTPQENCHRPARRSPSDVARATATATER